MLVCLLAVLAAAPHPYGIDDQVRLRRVQDFAVSPDGKSVVFALRSTDYEANRGRVALWKVGVDGGDLRQLTNSSQGESSPAWAPDGRSIYFLTSRSGTSQVWRLPVDGGEAVQVSRLALPVEAFKVSPDGKQLVVSVSVFVDCDIDCTQRRLDERAKSKATGQLYDSLFVRHWDEWSDGRRAHLFTVPIAGGPARDVMKKMSADAPTKPWGGSEEFTFTPDSKAVVFTAVDVGPAEAWSTDHDLFVAPADASAPPRKLTTSNRAVDTQPVFSPDGKTLAYLAMSRPGYESDRRQLMLRSWPDGKERSLAAGWDRSVSELLWSSDGRALLVTADDDGHRAAFSIDVATGAVTALPMTGSVHGLSSAANGLFWSEDSLTAPRDLYHRGADGKARALTRVNAEALAGVQLGEVERLSVKGWNGETVKGWLIKPVGFDARRKYPVAVILHGGPQGSMLNEFHYRWNPQPYAGRGYAVVELDFHGSTGYGQAFTDAIRDDWGGKPLEDVDKGLTQVLAQHPYLDGKRMCALGASYGGYLVNWIAGALPDRFRCLVSHDGNLDERAAYFNTEELWFPEWEHGGTPWENPAGYAKHNPVDHVAKWKTPMLVVHGGRDYRVVETEGLGTFNALQRRGIPSKLLYFPDENHWVLKPQNSVQWHQTVLGWLDQWSKP